MKSCLPPRRLSSACISSFLLKAPRCYCLPLRRIHSEREKEGGRSVPAEALPLSVAVLLRSAAFFVSGKLPPGV